jgi:transporter family-2 protein
VSIIFEFIGIALFAGLAAFQGPINSQLASRTGLFAANVLSNVIGTLALILVMAFVEPQALHFQYWSSRLKPGVMPPILLLGGILGSLFMVLMVIAIPRIGASGWVMAALAGQLVAARIVDWLGLFGVERQPVEWAQVLGILLVVAGALIVVRTR